MQHVGKSAGSSASSSPSAPGPPVEEPITMTPPGATGGRAIGGRSMRADDGVSPAGGVAVRARAAAATCAPAAALTLVTISRLSDAALTGAPAVYFSTKSTAP